MAEQSLLAKIGLRLGVLGSSASLAIAAPLANGDYSVAAATDATRIGVYFDRTALAEKIGFVVMGTESFAVTASGVIITGSFTLPVQTANTFFSGPATGAPAIPTFRVIVPADLPLFTSTTAGVVPASGGGTTNFIRADGTWAAPSGTFSGSIALNQVAYGAGANAIQGSANLTFTGTLLSVAANITSSVNGAVSAPAISLTGTWFSGGSTTTTKPQFLLEPTGTTSNAWSVNGTGIGINAAAGFGGFLMDMQLNGITKFRVNNNGDITASGTADVIGVFNRGQYTGTSNGAASTPPATFTGTWFTSGSATTTKPQVLIEPTGTTSTGWSTSGTGLGVNAPAGFVGNLLDLQLNGVSKVSVSSTGAITFTGIINTGTYVGSVNGAASTPAMSLTGSWFTGGSSTTTKPQFLVEASGATSTGWSTSGTGIGANAAAGFVGNLEDLQLNGVSKFLVTYQAVLTLGDNANSTSKININGAASTQRSLVFQTASVDRWSFRGGLGAESGANAGTSLLLEAMDDAGATLGNVLVVTRATAGPFTVLRPIVDSFTSLVSTPAGTWTGAWFTGGSATTTKPHLLLEPTGTTSTGWSTSGTGLGINATSGFVGKLIDGQVNGASVWSVDYTGTVTSSGLTLNGRLIITVAGAANAPAETLTGAWFTGGSATTTKPMVLIEPTGTTSTNWSTSGTGFGVNAATGFSGNLIDLQLVAVSKFNVNNQGNGTFAGTLAVNGQVQINAAGAASTSAAKAIGAWFTGGSSTTTKPQFLIEPNGTTSTGWNTNGTGLGVNSASGFIGLIVDFQANGSSVANLNTGGNWSIVGGLTTTFISASGTYSGVVNGAVSAPAMKLTGTWFSGGTATTTKPMFLMEPTGTTSTNWSTGGTGIGVNAASGFTGNLLDLQLNGATGLTVSASGNLATVGNAFISGILTTSTRFTNAGIGASGASANFISGTWFTSGTSTTTKPQLLVEPTGTTSTNWSTSGTGIGINSASGFAGNLLDLQNNGNNRFSINSAGAVTISSTITSSGAYVGSARITTSVSTTVSQSAISATGVWFTGGSASTTKPMFLIEDSTATSTNWSTAGTGIAANAASGFTGNLLDLQVNAGRKGSIDSSGNLTLTGTISGTSITATNTITGSRTPGANQFALTLTGTWFTGGTSTSTKPLVLIEPAGTTSTGWSTSGTGLGVNAASGFTGNIFDLQLNGVSQWSVSGGGLATFADGVNNVFGTTTGTKHGTATSQKQSLWNKTPIIQPTTGITAAAFVSNTSLIANDSATFGGYTIGQIAAALINFGLLA